MAYTSNNDKMLEAVLTDPDLMKFGDYNPAEVTSIYQAIDSDNVVVSAVADNQTFSRTSNRERNIQRSNRIFKEKRMIIKEISIRNFRSYYGENKFEFSEGLTLVIGDNGDGKTTFFEALQWLFNTATENNSIDNASEMRKSKLEIGESDEVAVRMVFDHDGEKIVEKRFTFERTSETSFKTSSITFRGYEDTGAGREVVNGKTLMDRCFDAFIQRFSMFKGESTLNVFQNAAALKELVDKFSDVREFDKLVEISAEMEDKSNKAYQKECKSDQKIATQAGKLESQLKRVSEDIYNKKKEIADKKLSVSVFSEKFC